jgi:hypothetical protein
VPPHGCASGSPLSCLNLVVFYDIHREVPQGQVLPYVAHLKVTTRLDPLTAPHERRGGGMVRTMFPSRNSRGGMAESEEEAADGVDDRRPIHTPAQCNSIGLISHGCFHRASTLRPCGVMCSGCWAGARERAGRQNRNPLAARGGRACEPREGPWGTGRRLGWRGWRVAPGKAATQLEGGEL